MNNLLPVNNTFTLARLRIHPLYSTIKGRSKMSKSRLISALNKAIKQTTSGSSASVTQPTSSQTSTKISPPMVKWNAWKKEAEKTLIGSGTLHYEYSEPSVNKNQIAKNTMTSVPWKDVPMDSNSIVMYSPYKDDPSDYKNKKFTKLSTCAKSCSNHGVFDISELEQLIDMATATASKCPFCGESFDLSKTKKRPPYGSLNVRRINSGSNYFFELDFDMKSGSVNGKYYSSRSQYAYIPALASIFQDDDSLLALYMMYKAFKAGKLFTVGTSVTHGTFGITFGGIHMKSQTSGGLANHGYGSNPMKELRDSVLPNLISECNSVGIFTPFQEDDFAKQAAKQKQTSKKSLPKRVSKKTHGSVKRKVSRKRRSAKRKVSRKRRSVKRKVSRKRRSVKRKVSRKRRSVKRKVSRKRKSAKKKTMKELRAECKARGLVYDPKTENCRPSKRRRRKAVVRKSRKLRPCKYGRNLVTGKCNKRSTSRKRRSVKRRSRKAVVRKSRKRRSVKRRSRKAVVRKSRKRRSVKRRSRKAAVAKSRKVASANILNATKTSFDTLSSLNLAPGDSLTPDQADLVQQAIYNNISSIVASSPNLSALSELLPSGGNIYYLLHYLDLMTQFQVQMLVFKSKDDYKKLIEQITKDLKAYLAEQHKQLQVYVQKMLQHAPEIVHQKADSFASKNLTWYEWNALDYTQVEPKYDISGLTGSCGKTTACGKVKASIKEGHWSCFNSCGHGKYDNKSLSQIANFNVEGNKDEVVMFHGSAGVAKSSLKKSVDWKRGGGYLGKGFYLTFNPNEAKIYACNAARRNNDSKGIVLEVVIKNASKFFERNEEDWDDLVGDKGQFARNHRKDMSGWWDQINCRDEIIRNMSIKRIHVIDTKNLRHYSKDKDPGNRGYYTVQSIKGHICG